MGQRLPLFGKRLLVAEDNFLVAEDMRRTIEEAGGTIVASEGDARRLGKLVDSLTFDCAVLDIQLHNGTSVETARTLKAQHRSFVFVTGYERSILPPDLYDAPYLGKPNDRPGLIELVVRALH